jgi:hypothetical protein
LFVFFFLFCLLYFFCFKHIIIIVCRHWGGKMPVFLFALFQIWPFRWVEKCLLDRLLSWKSVVGFKPTAVRASGLKSTVITDRLQMHPPIWINKVFWDSIQSDKSLANFGFHSHNG